MSALALSLAALGAVLGLAPVDPQLPGWVLAGTALLFLARRLLFNWTGALLALILVVMFIPARRFAVPSALPFELEPYRVLVAVLTVAVVVALLIAPDFTWQKSHFVYPMGFFLLTAALSVAARADHITSSGLGGEVLTAFSTFLMVFAVYFAVRQLLRSDKQVTMVVTTLVWAGAVVGLLALLERAADINLFLRLDRVLPLEKLREDSESLRAGAGRAFGSAQHPIALAVLMVILVPLALYLAKYARHPRNPTTRTIAYGMATTMLLAGVVAAVSRTAVVALGVMFLLTLIFRPVLAGLLAMIGTPLLFLAYALSPETINSTLGAFLDPDALIASQYTSAGWTGAGRLADLAPAMEQVRVLPFFGTGVGTRITVGEERNSFIVDSQVLGTLLDAGAVGLLGLVILFLVPPIRLLAASFAPGVRPRESALLFALSLSGAAYFSALFFLDAFNFMQAFIVIFVLFAVGSAVMAAPATATEEAPPLKEPHTRSAPKAPSR